MCLNLYPIFQRWLVVELCTSCVKKMQSHAVRKVSSYEQLRSQKPFRRAISLKHVQFQHAKADGVHKSTVTISVRTQNNVISKGTSYKAQVLTQIGIVWVSFSSLSLCLSISPPRDNFCAGKHSNLWASGALRLRARPRSSTIKTRRRRRGLGWRRPLENCGECTVNSIRYAHTFVWDRKF